MPLDPIIIQAIKAEIAEHDQPEPLEKRLVVWLQSLADGNTELHKSADVSRHLEGVLSAVVLPDLPGGED